MTTIKMIIAIASSDNEDDDERLEELKSSLSWFEVKGRESVEGVLEACLDAFTRMHGIEIPK